MKKQFSSLALFLCLVCAAATARAQSPQPQALTLLEAQKIAVQNHPQIQAVTNLASQAKAQVAQQRSAYYPLAYGDVTSVAAETDSRITAGAMNSSRTFDKYANGVTVDELVTDFGRTRALVKSANLHSQAAQENVVTSREDVLLGVDRSYFDVLKAQAVLQVAQETVKERQTVSDQVTELAKNKLRSGLDASFADVDLAQAQLLLIQAQNSLGASYAELSAALGYADQRTFHLADVPLPPAPPANFSDLLQRAFRDRPELISMRLDANSAHTYATAERDLWFPTVSAVGAMGLTPYGPGIDQGGLHSTRYAAAGVNVNIPIFNGHLFGALRNEANFQARAQDQYLRDMQDRISRDVRTAWLNANSAFQRLSVTDQLLNQANLALDLAQSRYKLGLSSIVELSQAQLNQTQAQIDWTSARYDYQTQIAILNFQLGDLQ
jgi:outer membrane protein